MNHLQIFLLVTMLQLQNGMIHAKVSNLLSLERIQSLVEDCWEAAPLNPSWGDRETVTLKLLASAYHETGFACKATHKNKNKTTDVGICQINSIHLAKTFPDFCKQKGLAYKPGLIWNQRINIAFAAYINELQIKSGGVTFVYKNSNHPDQKIIWTYLAKVPFFVKAIESHNDSSPARKAAP